jgi:deoxyxylulose-5-phosphate synthase
MILDRIQKENDIKNLTEAEIDELRFEIRQFLLESISKTGGHLASNLGVVELTMALHLVFDLPKDKIIWDVGHQSYTHKILTGRKEGFVSLRQYGGMSGFPKTNESESDCFNTGHSSTSISAGLGMAAARELTGEDYHVISVIGDGALTGGMAFEALNNASHINKNFIIVFSPYIDFQISKDALYTTIDEYIYFNIVVNKTISSSDILEIGSSFIDNNKMIFENKEKNEGKIFFLITMEFSYSTINIFLSVFVIITSIILFVSSNCCFKKKFK